MRGYYTETIEKDTKYRQDYVEGIQFFLQKKKSEADRQRKSFINPQTYTEASEMYRNRLIDMLGFPLREEKEIPVLQEKIFVATDKNVNIYRYQFTLLGDLKLYGLYFEQRKRPKDKPFIIGLHGGHGTPELVSSIHGNSANYNHLIRRMTDRGANVFIPQLLLWDKQSYGGEYNREHIDGKLRQLGGSITALEIYCLQRELDYFIEIEKVNKDRIAVAGLSYGGMYAVHLAAVDLRIKACYSCSWVNDSFVHSWADWSYLNAQYTFTAAEIVAMIAPRVLVVAMGNADELFDYKLTEKCCEYVRGYYEYLQKSELFKSIIFEGVHELDKGEEELDFLFKHL